MHAKCSEIRLFKQILTGPSDAAVKARVTLTSSANFYFQCALYFCFIITSFSKSDVTDESIAKLYAEERSPRQGLMTPGENA